MTTDRLIKGGDLAQNIDAITEVIVTAQLIQRGAGRGEGMTFQRLAPHRISTARDKDDPQCAEVQLLRGENLNHLLRHGLSNLVGGESGTVSLLTPEEEQEFARHIAAYLIVINKRRRAEFKAL